MIYSMTGFGRSEATIGDKSLVIEIKSLNGKQLEMNLKLASAIKPYEMEIRKIVHNALVRGSVEVAIYFVSQNGSSTKLVSINSDLLRSYYHQLKSISDELGQDTNQLMATLLTLPDVVATDQLALTPEEWQIILTHLNTTLDQVKEYRKQEGASIQEEIINRINNIKNLLSQVDIPEAQRIERIKERLSKAMIELGSLDSNRLEQEMVYFIERLDISEEKQRLALHCDLLLSLLDKESEEGIGKKMNFVLQEIGREINTLGSKANDAVLQRIVVDMKDDLEKCKEQSLNVM